MYPRGSTGELVSGIHNYLKERGIRSKILYGRGGRAKDPDAKKLCPEVCGKVNNLLSRFRGTMYGGCAFTTRKLIRILRQEQPDVVHLQCINGYFVNIYSLVQWLKQSGIPTVLTLHAEFMYTANCAHAMDCTQWQTGCESCSRWRQETLSWFRDGTGRSFEKMKNAFHGFEEKLTVVSVSPWLRERASRSRILGNMDHRVIFNGVDTDIFHWKPSGETEKERTVFFAAPVFSDAPDHPKGGAAVLEMAKRMPDVRFAAAGVPAVKGKLPENVTLLGKIGDREEMARWYRRADVTLLTSRRETFSMVCAESLCCGTPVVGFLAGGPESVCLPSGSTFVPWGDLDALEAALRRQPEKRVDRQALSDAAREWYSRERMGREYLALYREVIHESAP